MAPTMPDDPVYAEMGTGAVSRLLAEVTAIARQLGDGEAAEDVQVEAQAVTTHAARVVVVGEKKRGKSSLINALLRRPGLLPVDADIATSVHIGVYAADREQAHVFEGGDPKGWEITLTQISEYAALDPDTLEMRHPDVREVRVGLPDPFLRAGLELIDTPGVGGLVSGHAALTLAALSLADALLFVVDGSSELTASECAFLALATERVATVEFVLTQTDKYPDWRQVLRADQALIMKHARQFADARWFPVSSRMRLDAVSAAGAGDATRADDLERRSGFAPLQEELTGQVAGRAGRLREINAAWVARRVLDKLITLQEQRLRSLTRDPDLIAEIAGKRERLEDYRRADAMWRHDLDRGFRELGSSLSRLYQRRFATLKIDADRWAAEARTTTTSQITHDLDAGVLALWTVLEEAARKGVLLIGANIARQLDTDGIDALAGIPYPEELRRLPGLQRTEEVQEEGLPGVLNRYWPSMSGFSVTSMAGHLLFATVNPFALIGVGAIVAIGLFKGSQDRSATLRLRGDVQRYVRAVLTQTDAEMPAAIQDGLAAMRDAVQKFIADRMRARDSELQKTIAEGMSHLDTSEEELAPQRVIADRTLRRLRQLASLATQLTAAAPAPALGTETS
jgi:GTP-binding protein EngB required for normal cell division